MSRLRRALLVMLALALLAVPVDALLAALLPDASVAQLPGIIAGAAVTLLLLGLPAWLLRPWTSPRLPRGKSAVPGILAGVATGLLARFALSPLNAAWQSRLGIVPEALPMPESWLVTALYMVALAAIPALAEEAFFRGALLTSLLDGARRGTALLLPALFFALMHGSLANLPGLLILSLILSLLMGQTGRIAGPVAAHFVFNLTALAQWQLPLWGSLLCGAGLIGLAVYFCLRQPKVAHRPMGRADGLIAAGTLLVLLARFTL